MNLDEEEDFSIGSLFSGIGLLELAVEIATGGRIAWQVELSPFRREILAIHWPDALQHDDIRTFTKASMAIASPAIVCGGWPCFPAGTLITTREGHVPIEQIKVGDFVLTHEKRWRRVTETMRREDAPLISVRATGAPTLRTTPEHPFYVRRARRYWENSVRNWRRRWDPPCWVEASQLQPDDYLAQPIDGDEIDMRQWGPPAFWYIVGRWLGDGWLADYERRGKAKRDRERHGIFYKFIICCGKHEEDELASKIKEAGLHAVRVEERTVIKFSICSKTLVLFLRHFGRGAPNKRLPGFVYGAPVESLRSLWEGWIDSDGTRDDRRTRGSTVSRDLALGMSRVARKCFGVAVALHHGRKSATCVIEGRTVNQRDSFDVFLSKENKSSMIDDGFAWVRVRQVTPLEETATVYNFEVEEDNSYVAESFVVHNCVGHSNAGKRRGFADERSGLWSEYARILDEHRPHFAFLENVRALEGRGLEVVLEDLDRLGYKTRRGLLAAGDPNRHGLPNVGAPHERQRIWILAYADEERLRQLAERCQRVEAKFRYALDQHARAELANATAVGRSRRPDDAERGSSSRQADQQRDAELADADPHGRQGSSAPGRGRAARDDDGSRASSRMADTGEGRLEGQRSSHDDDRSDAPWHDDDRRRAAAQCFAPDWPPGSDPDDPRWPAWLERNVGCQPAIHRGPAGSAGRLDRWARKARVAALGDSVTLTAAYWAFRGLVEPRGQLGLWGSR